MDRQVAPLWSPSQAAVAREGSRRPTFYTYLNLWPFVGILFVLLFLFMVLTPPIHHDIGPRLPSSFYASPQPQASREDAMRVSIIRDGRVSFRNTGVVPEELPSCIRNALQSGAEKKVYLAVDLRSKFADTALVVEQISKAGVHDICFLTEQTSPR